MSWTSCCFSWREDRWDHWALGRATCGNRPIKAGRVDCYCSPPPGMLSFYQLSAPSSRSFPRLGPRSHHVLPCHTVPSLRLHLSLLIFTFLTALAPHLSKYLEISHERPEKIFTSCSVLCNIISRRYNQQTETESRAELSGNNSSNFDNFDNFPPVTSGWPERLFF